MRNLIIAIATVVVLGAIAVLSPGTVPPEIRDALGFGPSRLATAPHVSGGGTYRFMQHQRGDPDAPVAYDPCQPIHVRVNTDGVSEETEARSVVLSAMDEVSRATGLRLEYDGSSTDRPRWRSSTEPILGGAKPVLVSFATSDEVPQLAGRVAGVGGSTWVQRGGIGTYVTGQVTLDIATFDPLLSRPAFRATARAIALHELGHLVGLAHVPDQGELMYAQNNGQIDFGPGDRAGLALLGQGRCS